jgi:23S rRNA pseudouridine1911/1915/1917 synthase
VLVRSPILARSSKIMTQKIEEEVEEGADNIYRLAVEAPEQCGRLDKILSTAFADLSRSRIQALIEDGQVLLNDAVCDSSSKKLQIGDVVMLSVPPPVDATPKAEKIALDIVYEDEDLLVLHKPAGLVVHPGAGNYEGTLVNALLHHCKGSLSGIGGVMRPGIVHRLDKETSGLMVVAKNDMAHKGLSAQLEDRSLSRVYQALVFKVPFPSKSVVDQPLARHPSNRLKMAVAHRGGKAARTHYHVQQKFGEACALVECKLESGRTHQIRVHMESLGHPLIGDPLYGPQKNGVSSALKKAGYDDKTIQEALNFPRQALHAGALAFTHPGTDELLEFTAPLPDDMSKLLKLLNK